MIEFYDVHKAFGAKSVLRGLTFTVRDGSVTGFVGPNGAGKSTAMKILVGLLNADSGRALIDGVPHRELQDVATSIGVFLGADYLPGSMTGEGYLRYVCDLQGIARRQGQEMLEMVDLGPASRGRVSGYSMGMRQRLGLASALVGDARNLVLDEPVNGLDVEGVKAVRDRLRVAADSGRCVLLSSHLLSELALVATDIVILGGGVTARQGSLTELTSGTDHEVVVTSEDPKAVLDLLLTAGASAARGPDGIRVSGQTVNWVASALGASELPIKGIVQATRAIEDIYLEETDRSPARPWRIPATEGSR